MNCTKDFLTPPTNACYQGVHPFRDWSSYIGAIVFAGRPTLGSNGVENLRERAIFTGCVTQVCVAKRWLASFEVAYLHTIVYDTQFRIPIGGATSISDTVTYAGEHWGSFQRSQFPLWQQTTHTETIHDALANNEIDVTELLVHSNVELRRMAIRFQNKQPTV